MGLTRTEISWGCNQQGAIARDFFIRKYQTPENKSSVIISCKHFYFDLNRALRSSSKALGILHFEKKINTPHVSNDKIF